MVREELIVKMACYEVEIYIYIECPRGGDIYIACPRQKESEVSLP